MVLSLLVAVVLYPRAIWLLWFLPVGVALFLFIILTAKEPTPEQVADLAHRLLSGSFGRWDVDDYEHINPKDPRVRELWQKTMIIGGLPEVWPRLNEETKNQLRDIVRDIRQLSVIGK